MSYSLPSSARNYLDTFNENFEKENGYTYFRCLSCVFPILIEACDAIGQGEIDAEKLGKILSSINDDYIMSADYKMGRRKKSGLQCGYDCKHYEERLEACPFAFWEIDKTKIGMLVPIIKKIRCDFT